MNKKIPLVIVSLFLLSLAGGLFAYHFSTHEPSMSVDAESVKYIHDLQGTVMWLGPMILVVPPGTYAHVGNMTLTSYEVTLMLTSGPGFALEVDNSTEGYFTGKILPFVLVFAPNTWSTVKVNYSSFDGNFTGVSTAGQVSWMYGDGIMFSNASPGLYKFVTSTKPFGEPPKTVSYPVKPAFGLTPVNGVTYEINGTKGGVTVDSNLIVVVQPGTYQRFSNGTVFKDYNFSLVYYSPYNISVIPFPDQYPFLAFAYAVNGQVTYNESSNKPYITVILSPSAGGMMWDWGMVDGHPGYVIDPHVLVGQGSDDNVVVNLNFKRPVPWIFTLTLD
ncbi:hypothetical protein IC006_0953 [Sulfuracidifex tepidarius]|uniref:Uncharacterized protein n=1 Tax=Sulfuracidifex tepidarius TaxID=1294262 RepID=A0A510DU18_9CREN|nr:hypothetical protein [Sulfuracidifex tepidarius]BBG23665.1 hypothetical protein IC006_0953 [Sulfuracidifex tepidarius]